MSLRVARGGGGWTHLGGAASLALVLLTVSLAAADDTGETRTETSALVGQFASPDEVVRAEAARRIVELGTDAIEQAARTTADLDDAGWKSFAEAVRDAERSCWPIPFVAAAYTAPDAHRKRLLVLASEIDPRAGQKREPEGIAEIVREYLIDRRNERCIHGHDTAVAILGHAAVPVVLDLLRGPERNQVSGWVAYAALERIVELDDIPALRELLLAGEARAAMPLGHLQRRGMPEASEALLTAVETGHFDKAIAEALVSTPDRARTVKVVRAWMADRAEPTEEDRSRAAELFGKLGPKVARGTVEDLERWLSASEKPWAISAIATALTHLGSPRGVETLVRLVGEGPHGGRCSCKCCQSKPAPEVPPGSLCAEGFEIWDRWPATKLLAKVAGPDVFTVPSDDERDAARRAARNAGREPETTEELVERAAAAYREWWEVVKDRISFDAVTGRWSVAP